MNENGAIVEVWKVYKGDSQECIYTRTKGLAKRFGIQVFGKFDAIGKASVFLSLEEQRKINDNGFVFGD